jgi:hypothetical protein
MSHVQCLLKISQSPNWFRKLGFRNCHALPENGTGLLNLGLFLGPGVTVIRPTGPTKSVS